MRRRTIEKWISRAIDGELTPRRATKLQAYLERHPEYRQLQASWNALGQRLREVPARSVASPDAAWEQVRRRIEAGRRQTESRAADRAVGLSGRWIAAGAAAVATLAILWGAALWRYPATPGQTEVAAQEAVDVDWVDTDLSGAMPLVFQDIESGWTIIWVGSHETGGNGAG